MSDSRKNVIKMLEASAGLGPSDNWLVKFTYGDGMEAFAEVTPDAARQFVQAAAANDNPERARLEEIIAQFLRYSFRDINFCYDGLTEGDQQHGEKSICTRTEFERLMTWVGERVDLRVRQDSVVR